MMLVVCVQATQEEESGIIRATQVAEAGAGWFPRSSSTPVHTAVPGARPSARRIFHIYFNNEIDFFGAYDILSYYIVLRTRYTGGYEN